MTVLGTIKYFSLDRTLFFLPYSFSSPNKPLRFFNYTSRFSASVMRNVILLTLNSCIYSNPFNGHPNQYSTKRHNHLHTHPFYHHSNLWDNLNNQDRSLVLYHAHIHF